MKARVKATGEIVEINETHTEIFTDVHDNAFSIDEIDFNVVERKDPDYWTRLEHQYAGMAMQGILSGNSIMERIARFKVEDLPSLVANLSIQCAHALVEKMKEEK